MALTRKRERSTATAALAGIGVGLSALLLYVVAGLLVAEWSVADFLAHLTLETVGVLLLAGSLAIACFAVPVTGYLRFRLRSPLVVLVVVLVGWVTLGLARGTLTAQTVFGLAVYAMYLSPLYVLLYAVVGGIEHAVRE